MQIFGYASDTSRGARGCECRTYDERDGGYGNVPSSCGAPVLWILNVVGAEIEVAVRVQVYGFIFHVLASVGLRCWS